MTKFTITDKVKILGRHECDCCGCVMQAGFLANIVKFVGPMEEHAFCCDSCSMVGEKIRKLRLKAQAKRRQRELQKRKAVKSDTILDQSVYVDPGK